MQCEQLDDDGHEYILDKPHPQIESEKSKDVLSLTNANWHVMDRILLSLSKKHIIIGHTLCLLTPLLDEGLKTTLYA